MQSNVIASNRPIPPRVMAVMRRMSRSRWATLAMLLFGLLGLSACGSRPGPVAAKSAVAKNTPSPSNVAAASGSSAARSSGSSSSGILLYAVVESHTKTNGLATYDTVAIAGLDGYARAKTTFTPATPPYVGCLGPLLPLEAHVAAGRVFYVDGKGIVRSLGLDKTVKQAAAFPIGPQQEVSFAVSPDGRHLLGTVLTIPPKPATDPCTSQGNGFAPGNWSEDVYAADAGGASRLISHRSWPAGQQADVLSFVGWDAIGPLGTSPTGYGTQGGGPIREGWYGRVGTDTCYADDVAVGGSYVCSGQDSIDVFNPDGSPSWKFSAPNQGYMVPLLSPDLRHVEALGPMIVGKDGSSTPIGNPQPNGPSDFYAGGWLDAQTVIGWHNSGSTYNEMTIVRLSAPSKLVDLGFQGTFVGVVQSG